MVCFLLFIFFISIKISYYWFNRKELLTKAHEKYHKQGGKEKAASYYQRNKDAINKKAKEKYKNLSKEEKDKIRERSKNRYHKLKRQYKE